MKGGPLVGSSAAGARAPAPARPLAPHPRGVAPKCGLAAAAQEQGGARLLPAGKSPSRWERATGAARQDPGWPSGDGTERWRLIEGSGRVEERTGPRKSR